MAVVISATVRTFRDVQGNSQIQGNFLIEFRDATYFAGLGENIDLSPYMQRVEYVTAQPAQLLSAAVRYFPQPNYTAYPVLAGSGNIQLFHAVSGLLEVVSGNAVSGARAVLTVWGA